MIDQWWGRHRFVKITPGIPFEKALAKLRRHCEAEEQTLALRPEAIFFLHNKELAQEKCHGPVDWSFSHVLILEDGFGLAFEDTFIPNDCKRLVRWIIHELGPCRVENELGEVLS